MVADGLVIQAAYDYVKHIDLEWSERERLSLSAFLGTEDIGVHIVHISRAIITYTLE